MPYNAPHGPIQAPEKYVNRFPNIDNPLRKIYAGMISSMDDGIGKILTKLKKKKFMIILLFSFFLIMEPLKRWTDKDGQTAFQWSKGSDLGEGGVEHHFYEWPKK